MAEDAPDIDTGTPPVISSTKDDTPHLETAQAPLDHENEADDSTPPVSSSTKDDTPHLESAQAPLDDENEADDSTARRVRFDESTIVTPSIYPHRKMVTEIILCLVKDRLMAIPIHRDQKNREKRHLMELSEISEFPNVDTFVFEDPVSFSALFSSPELPERSLQLFAKHGVAKVRFMIPNRHEEGPASPPRHPFTKLDAIEREGREKLAQEVLFYESFEYERDPVAVKMEALFQKWRSACRALPKGHGIREVIFDVSKPVHKKEKPYTSSLFKRPIIQHISTIMAMKAGGSFSTRLVGFENDEGRRLYHEKAMFNIKVPESEELATEGGECEPLNDRK
ncbi:unnamed protein product [Penicillium bialowiezense]